MPSLPEKGKGRYSLSFTTGSLFHPESVKLAALFLEFKDWNAVRERVLADNLLQARTLNTSQRVCREILSRLKTLDIGELDLLVHGSTQEQGYLLWIAVCRRYRVIADFAREILRERFISLQTDLHDEDFDAFLRAKSAWHPEFDKIRPATKTKLRQVLFKMLREADLITPNRTIHGALLSRPLLEAIARENRQDVLLFPAFESEIKEWRP